MTQGERKNYSGQKQGRQLINSESLVHPFPIESKERSKEIESEAESCRAQEDLYKPLLGHVQDRHSNVSATLAALRTRVRAGS